MRRFASLRLLYLSISLVATNANFPLIDPCLKTCNDDVKLQVQQAQEATKQTCDQQQIPRFLFAGQSNMVRL